MKYLLQIDLRKLQNHSRKGVRIEIIVCSRAASWLNHSRKGVRIEISNTILSRRKQNHSRKGVRIEIGCRKH